MSVAASIEADPSQIGGVPKAPFVILPDSSRLFQRRSSRFEALAADSTLSPYLRFLGALAHQQADLASSLPPPEPLPAAQIARARTGGMPPLDRVALAECPALLETLDRLFDAAASIEKPDMAHRALKSLRDAGPAGRAGIVRNVLSQALPAPDALAQHLYVAAAVQIVAAATAGTLDAGGVAPVEIGVCPVCGALPVVSLITGFQGADGVRYAVCSCCATQWNEVRVKCLACGSTKGISYRAVDEGADDATIKAEVCDECGSWVKVLYQNKNPSLEAVADDVASLGLNVLMRDSQYRPAGHNPFLIGY
jgi:FdhE protein